MNIGDLQKALDSQIKEFLSKERWINSETEIGAWKREELRKGIMNILEELFSAFQKNHDEQIHVDRKRFEEWMRRKTPNYGSQFKNINQYVEVKKLVLKELKELLEASK